MNLAYCLKPETEVRLSPSSTNVWVPQICERNLDEVTEDLLLKTPKPYQQLWAQGKKKVLRELGQAVCLFHEAVIFPKSSQSKDKINTCYSILLWTGPEAPGKGKCETTKALVKKDEREKENNRRKQKYLTFKMNAQTKTPNI